MKKGLVITLIVIVAVLLISFLVSKKVHQEAFYGSAGSSNVMEEFEAKEGEGSTEVGKNLQKAGIIKHRYYFYYYVWKTDTAGKLQAGIYEFAPNMMIGELVEKMTAGEVKSKILKLTVPEGYSNEKIVEALRNKRPAIADEFENIVMCKCLNQAACECDVFNGKYDFLKQIPAGVDMEGYLFPDTYFIDEEETGTTLASKFLNNYQRKVSSDLRSEVARQGKTLHEVMTMASIIEREVKTEKDRKLVSGIFWQRIADTHPLQSCATLAYFLGVDKIKFSTEDTKTVSLYNTYTNPGLPPGPIANPGLASIEAAIYPQDSSYYYFLSDPETEEIIYSETSDEHSVNKEKHGL